MTTYYIDFINGTDTNNGLGPDATTANTNKPWKTLSKALSTGSPVTSGDTVYLSPSGIHRLSASITIGISPTSLSIIGDPGNAQGFKNSSGVLAVGGPVIVSAWATDTATTSYSINYNGNGNISWQLIGFEASVAAIHAFGTVSSAPNVSFTDCSFQGGRSYVVTATAGFGVALNLTFDRCIAFARYFGVLQFACTQGTGSDYDINVVVKNSLIMCPGEYGINLLATGSGANLGNGVHVYNCTFICWTGLVLTTGLSTSSPSTVYNSVFMGATGINAATAGQVTEDYNVFDCNTARANTTSGTHSQSTYMPRFHFGQENIWGRYKRPFGEPFSTTPLLAFGNNGSQTSYDGLNRPRPAGGVSATPAVGWLERADTSSQGTSPAPPSGTKTWQGTGPWYQDFILPVNTTSTTVAVKVQRDANYTGTNPQLKILAQPELGVSVQTITDTGSSASWNTLTAAAFTPTNIGAVTVRLYSGDTSGTSVVEFANITVT